MAFGSQQYPRQQYTTWPASDRPLLAWKPVQWSTSATPDSRYASVAPSKPVADIVKEYSNFVKPIQTSDQPRSIESIANPVQSQASSTPSTNAFSAFTNQFWGAENVGSIPWLDKSTVPTNTGMQDNSMQANPEQFKQISNDYNGKQNEAVWSLLDDIKLNGITEKEIQQLYPEFANLSPDVIGALYDDIKFNGIQENEVQNLYPEIYTGIKSDKQIEDMNNPLNAINPFIWEWQAWGRYGNLGSEETIPYMPTTNNAETTPEVFAEFGKNALKSAWNLWAGIGNMALNPVDSIKTIGKLWLWALANTYEAITGDEMDWENAKLASAVGQYFATRYGSMEWFQKASYEDPVWVFSDLASILSWWATIAGKTAALTSKVAKLWWATKVASWLDMIADWARAIAKVWDTIDPATYAMKWAIKPYQMAGTVVKKWANMLADSKAGQYVSDKAKSAFDMTGLKPEEKASIQNNPYFKEEITLLQEIWEEGQSVSQKTTQRLQDVTDEIVSKVDEKIWNLEQTWPLYEQIKSNPKEFSFEPVKTSINWILSKYDIKVNSDWSLDFSNTNLGSQWDMNKIQRAYDRIMDHWDTSNAKKTINLRQAIDDMKNYELWQTSKLENILSNFRGAIDDVAKTEIEWLKDTDSMYSKQIAELKDLKKWLTDKKWDVLAWAYSKVKNANTLANTAFAEKLDKYFPWTKERVDAINSANKIYSKMEAPWKTTLGTKLLLKWVEGTVSYAVWQAFWPLAWVGTYVLWHIVEHYIGKALDNTKKSQIEKIINTITPEQIKTLEIVWEAIKKWEIVSSKQKQQFEDTLANIQKAVWDEKANKLEYEQFVADIQPKLKALPEKATPTDIGTESQPIVWKAPENTLERRIQDKKEYIDNTSTEWVQQTKINNTEPPKPKTILDTIVAKKIAERKAKVVEPVKEVASKETDITSPKESGIVKEKTMSIKETTTDKTYFNQWEAMDSKQYSKQLKDLQAKWLPLNGKNGSSVNALLYEISRREGKPMMYTLDNSSIYWTRLYPISKITEAKNWLYIVDWDSFTQYKIPWSVERYWKYQDYWMNKTTKKDTVAPASNDLLQEAKKYKTAEEMINNSKHNKNLEELMFMDEFNNKYWNNIVEDTLWRKIDLSRKITQNEARKILNNDKSILSELNNKYAIDSWEVKKLEWLLDKNKIRDIRQQANKEPQTPTKPQGEKPKNDVLSRAIDKVKSKKKVETSLWDIKELSKPEAIELVWWYFAEKNALRKERVVQYMKENSIDPKEMLLKLTSKDKVYIDETISKIVNDTKPLAKKEKKTIIDSNSSIKTKDMQDLYTEARKYKSADDMIKWLENKGKITYHWTDADIKEFSTEFIWKWWDSQRVEWAWLWNGIYLTDKPQEAKYYADLVAKQNRDSTFWLEDSSHIKKINEMFDKWEITKEQYKEMFEKWWPKRDDFSRSTHIIKTHINWKIAKDKDIKDIFWNKLPKKYINDWFGKKIQIVNQESINKALIDKWFIWREESYNMAGQKLWWKESANNIVIFDPKNIKTESQLRKIREEANK